MHLKPALRALWKRPLLSLTAIATIALGVGANSAIFSVVIALSAILLPARRASRADPAVILRADC